MEDPLVLMLNGPGSVAVIGERVIINCTATTELGVTELPTLTVAHPNGTTLSSTEGVFISTTLDPVHVTDAGEYTCTGTIDLENITSVTLQVKQNFTFKRKCTQSMSFLKISNCILYCLVPTPTIDIAYDERPLEVGSSTVLDCTVTNYSITDFDVFINVTWSRSGMALSNDSGRVVIFRLPEMTSRSISRLTVSPLSASDDDITCSANAYLAIPNPYIETSSTVSKHTQLNIEGTIIIIIASLLS